MIIPTTYLLNAILTEIAERIGDNTTKTKEKDINKYKLGYGSKFDFRASEELIPKTKIGIVKGRISRGETMFPVFAPRVREEQTEPIKQIAKLPIKKINKFHIIRFKLKPKTNDNIVNVIKIGKINASQ